MKTLKEKCVFAVSTVPSVSSCFCVTLQNVEHYLVSDAISHLVGRVELVDLIKGLS